MREKTCLGAGEIGRPGQGGYGLLGPLRAQERLGSLANQGGPADATPAGGLGDLPGELSRHLQRYGCHSRLIPWLSGLALSRRMRGRLQL